MDEAPIVHVNLLAELSQAAAKRELRFLVIGGFAVAAHGYGRTTRDVDIVVCREDRAAWLTLLSGLGYAPWHDGGSFLQFHGPPDSLPLDAMLANSDTFAKLMAGAQSTVLEETQVLVPDLPSLLAMKLHALKHGGLNRQFSDLDDILQLLSVNRINPRAPEIRALFERYGSPEHYERVLKALG